MSLVGILCSCIQEIFNFTSVLFAQLRINLPSKTTHCLLLPFFSGQDLTHKTCALTSTPSKNLPFKKGCLDLSQSVILDCRGSFSVKRESSQKPSNFWKLFLIMSLPCPTAVWICLKAKGESFEVIEI